MPGAAGALAATPMPAGVFAVVSQDFPPACMVNASAWRGTGAWLARALHAAQAMAARARAAGPRGRSSALRYGDRGQSHGALPTPRVARTRRGAENVFCGRRDSVSGDVRDLAAITPRDRVRARDLLTATHGNETYV